MSKDEKKQEEEVEKPTIRIILKSRETKNLQNVTNTLISRAKGKQLEISGPRFMPNKHLKITTRKSPCGEGTNTWQRFDMVIHTRIIDIRCQPNEITEVTGFKIKPGVDISMKIF